MVEKSGKSAQNPMNKGFEVKIAIVDNFFSKRQKIAFFEVKIAKLSRTGSDEQAAEPQKMEEKTAKRRKRLGAGGGENEYCKLFRNSSPLAPSRLVHIHCFGL